MAATRVAQSLFVGRAQIDVLVTLSAMPNRRILGRRQFLPLARALLTENRQWAVADGSLRLHGRLRRITQCRSVAEPAPRQHSNHKKLPRRLGPLHRRVMSQADRPKVRIARRTGVRNLRE